MKHAKIIKKTTRNKVQELNEKLNKAYNEIKLLKKIIKRLEKK